MSALVTIGITKEESASFRERGRFSPAGGPAQTAMRQLNNNLSVVLAAKLGDLIDQEIMTGGREAASSGRLKQVSTSRGNMHVTAFVVGIGRPDFLNKSSAKYWRTFEEGSARVWKRPFVGTYLWPVGGFRGAGFNDPGSRRKVPFPVAHGQRPGLRTRSTPFPGGGFIVRHEIEPANAYAKLAQVTREDLLAHGINQARRYLQGVFGEENMTVVAGPPPGAPPVRFY